MKAEGGGGSPFDPFDKLRVCDRLRAGPFDRLRAGAGGRSQETGARSTSSGLGRRRETDRFVLVLASEGHRAPRLLVRGTGS